LILLFQSLHLGQKITKHSDSYSLACGGRPQVCGLKFTIIIDSEG